MKGPVKQQKKKKANDKIDLCKIYRNVMPKLYHIFRIQIRLKRANRVDPDEVAHVEPPHLDLHFLQAQQFSFYWRLKVIIMVTDVHVLVFWLIVVPV